MATALSQKLSCLTPGVQSSTVTVIPDGMVRAGYGKSIECAVTVSASKSATKRFVRSCPLACTTGIRYYVAVQYEWDNGKAAENLRKHDVDFADAVAALEDPNRVEEIDSRFVYGEERVQVIGMAHNKVLFVVVTLPGEDTCRIISARKATRHEQDRYYAGDRETW